MFILAVSSYLSGADARLVSLKTLRSIITASAQEEKMQFKRGRKGETKTQVSCKFAQMSAGITGNERENWEERTV